MYKQSRVTTDKKKTSTPLAIVNDTSCHNYCAETRIDELVMFKSSSSKL